MPTQSPTPQNPPRPASWQAMRERMLELGWTESEVSRRSGVPQPTVWRILNGESKDPRYENVLKVMTALGMAKNNRIEEHPAPDYSGLANTTAGPELQGRVPLISWVTAGEMCEVIDLWEPGVAEEWLDCPFPHSRSAYCLKVVGLSMFPEYRDGETILVDPAIEAEHGDDVIVRTPDQTATFKRLHKSPDGVHLVALNPDMPNRIIEIPKGSVICGVVTGSWKSRRRS